MVGIKVFVPATINGLATRSGILSVALDNIGDEFILKEGEKEGITVSSIKGNKNIPLTVEENVAAYTAYSLLKHLDKESTALDLEIRKKIPVGIGLGSFVASAVGGVVAVNEYFNNPIDKKDLLHIAVNGAQKILKDQPIHTLISSMMGGMHILRDKNSLDFKRIYTPRGLQFLIIKLRLKHFKRIDPSQLKTDTNLDKMSMQMGNLSSFISSCYTSDFELMKRSLADSSYNLALTSHIPMFEEIKSIAINNGALGFNISGNGPIMYAICKNTTDADNIKTFATILCKENNTDVKFYTSTINAEGAVKQ